MTLSATPTESLSASSLRALFAALVLSCFIAAPFANAQATKTSSGTQAPASPFNGTIVEQRVAQVNDQIITLSDYERAQEQMDADAKQQGWTEQELQGQKQDLLRDLIDKELLLSKGKELNITGETELVKRLDELRKQNHLDSMEDLEKAAQSQGVSYEDFKQKIRDEIIIQEVSRQEVARHIQMTKAEVDTYYRAHQADFNQPEAVHLQEILIPVASDDATALAAAQQKAADVEAKLKTGANFSDLAKQESSGTTASTGGDFGDFKRGQLAKPFEDATFSLKSGQVAEPIRTKQGLLIFKVTQHVGGSSQDYASIEPQVEEAAFMNRMQPAMRTYLTTLRGQAYIDIRDGYKDAGSSGTSVKPLYTAYTPPGQKKAKVKKAKTRAFRDTGRAGRSKAPAPRSVASSSPTPPAEPGSTPLAASAPVTTAVPATAATATAPGSETATPPAQVASNTSTSARSSANMVSSKPVRKQKVRYGQAPRGTLDSAPGNDAPTPVTNAETQVASNVGPDVTAPGMTTNSSGTAEKKTRTRFSARRGKKVKGVTQDQLENQSQGQATPEEVATQKTQAAPLGLNGDTTKKKKAPKVKSDQKLRYADKPKPAPSAADATNATTPEAGAPATGSAPPASTPDEKSPLDATPSQAGQTAPAAPNTPPTPPQ